MPLIPDRDKRAVAALFEQKLTGPVKLVMFTQRQSPILIPGMPVCDSCEETEQLVREVAELSEKITAEIYDFVRDEQGAKAHGMDKIPAIALIGAKDYGVRFYGMPAGYEFAALVEAIIDVSRGSTDLEPGIKSRLRDIHRDAHIQVFTTPT
jgi:alkyl hydroperoxide reductase subunit AhpF